MKTKILITGAGGYIGSNTVYYLLKEGYEVVGIDNFTTGFKQPLEVLQNKFGQDQFRYYEIDLQNLSDDFFKKEDGIEAVIHFAAFCSVDDSMKDPKKYFDNNTLITKHLIDVLVKNNIKKLVFSSTCAVYGEAEYLPIDEKHPTCPTNPYGESKLMAERVMHWYGELLGLKYVVLRYFNVAGASDDGVIGYSKKPSNLLIQNAVRGALGIEPFFITCPDVDTPDKTPTRDYVDVVDLAVAHAKAVDYLGMGGDSEVINLGSGNGFSVKEIITEVQSLTGVDFPINKTTPRLGEYAKTIASIEKAKKVLDWAPTRALSDMVNTLMIWFKSHPNGWDY